VFCENEMFRACCWLDIPTGAGPRILVLIGRTAIFPTWRTSGSSFNDE
jgi:hypothetical protein